MAQTPQTALNIVFGAMTIGKKGILCFSSSICLPLKTSTSANKNQVPNKSEFMISKKQLPFSMFSKNTATPKSTLPLYTVEAAQSNILANYIGKTEELSSTRSSRLAPT
jgi:hypothetical protein